MSLIPDDIKSDFKKKLLKSNNGPTITIDEEEMNGEDYLSDINNHFNDDEQIELVENGIKLTTAKEYKTTILKSPIWQGRITKAFKTWLKENHPDDVQFLKKTEKKSENETTYLTPADISRKITENRKNNEEANNIEVTELPPVIPEKLSFNEHEETMIDIISHETGFSRDDILLEIKKKKQEFNGLVSNDGAIQLVAKEYKLNIENVEKSDNFKKSVLSKPEQKKTPKKTLKLSKKTATAKANKITAATATIEATPKKSIINPLPIVAIDDVHEIEKYPLQKFDVKQFPSEEEIKFLIKRHKFVKDNLLDSNDLITIKRNKFVKKSGWRKFINAFGISIELIEQRVYEQFDDKHAEIRVRAVAPNGQSVEGIGVKSWSELYDKTMHNLLATAWTRAVNRAVSDLVGYGEVSAEELSNEDSDDEPAKTKKLVL